MGFCFIAPYQCLLAKVNIKAFNEKQIKPIPEYPKKSRFLLEFVNVCENKFMLEESSLKLIQFYKFA